MKIVMDVLFLLGLIGLAAWDFYRIAKKQLTISKVYQKLFKWQIDFVIMIALVMFCFGWKGWNIAYLNTSIFFCVIGHLMWHGD